MPAWAVRMRAVKAAKKKGNAELKRQKSAKKAAEAKQAAEEDDDVERLDGIAQLAGSKKKLYGANVDDDDDDNERPAADLEARSKMDKRLEDMKSQLEEIRAKDGTNAMPKKHKPLNFRWQLLPTTLCPQVDSHPVPRSGHAAWTISENDPRIFIHGGAGSSEDKDKLKAVEHIYALHTESLKWNVVHTYKKPRHRTYHTVNVVGPNTKLPEHLQIPRLVCVGGYNQGAIDHDNYALVKWSMFLDGQGSHMKMAPRGLPDTPKEVQGIKDVWQEMEKLHSGDVPLGRCNHTATLVGSSILVVFGGWHTEFVDDVYTLDVTSWRWTYRQPKLEALEQLQGNPVAPRAGHTATLLPGRKLLVFGGQNKSGPLGDLALLDLTNMTWYRPKPAGNPPSKRSGHTANYKDGKVFIYGGWDGIRQRDDIHVLSVSGDPMTDWRWETVNVAGSRIGGRVGHTATFVGSRLFIIGGWSKGVFHNDVHVLQTSTAVSKLKTGLRRFFKGGETMLEKLTAVVVDKEEMSQYTTGVAAEAMAAMEEMHSARSLKLQRAEDEEANLAKINEEVDKKLERAIGVVEARKLQAAKAAADREKEARRIKQKAEGEYRKNVIAIGLKRGMTLSDAMAVAERGETLIDPSDEDDRLKPPPVELLEANPIITQEDINAVPTSFETATSMWVDHEFDMLEKIAATGGLAATYEEDEDGDGIPDFLQAELEEEEGGNVNVLQGAYAAAYAREKNKYKSMRENAEGRTTSIVPKGTHRPRRGPNHHQNAPRLTLEELREEKRADPLGRQDLLAVLPPLAAAGDADAGDYALSSDDRALAVSKVSDHRMLRRAFVGDFLSTSAPLLDAGRKDPSNSSITGGLPFGIYRIISRMQAMARGYLTRKRMLEMKAVMRIQAMVRGRIARRKVADKTGGRTFDAFVGTAKETAKSKFRRMGGVVKMGVRMGGQGGGLLSRLSSAADDSAPSTPSISDSDEDVSDPEEEEEEEYHSGDEEMI